MEQKISMTLNQLESLLSQQKELVINRLEGNSSYYNSKSDAGSSYPLTIDRDKFKETGMETRFPPDFIVLKKYIS